jgi:5-methylcytosine-specific restriction endonuclease McrA
LSDCWGAWVSNFFAFSQFAQEKTPRDFHIMPEPIETSNLTRKKLPIKAWVTRFLQHGPWCHYCHVRLTIDTAVREHLTPLCRGGRDVAENIVPACAECNDMKAWRTEEEFLRDREMLLSRRTGARTIAPRGEVVNSLEERVQPGLLKKVVTERDGGPSWAWRNPAC